MGNEKMTIEEFWRKQFDLPLGEAYETEEERRQKRYLQRLEAANIPRRYKLATFENLERWGVPQDIMENYQKAKEYAATFSEQKDKGCGVLFAGSVGRMKTTLAVSILHEVIKTGYSGYFISMPELMDVLFSESKSGFGEVSRFQSKVENTSLLVLDDFGAEYENNWVINKVDAIITHRYNAMLPVIITTNFNNSEIMGRYAQRVWDRLKQTNLVLLATGKSLRKEKTT